MKHNRGSKAERIDPIEDSPWPAMVAPKSLTPASRLIADMMIPPMNPMLEIPSDKKAASRIVIGVIHHSAVPIPAAEMMPPMSPSQVLCGLICGAT